MFYVTRKHVCDKCGKTEEVTKVVAGILKDEPIVLPDKWSIYIDRESIKLTCDACNALTK